jgi:CHAT domain-containing protein/tetratricopeptide (TPR) repeat protein
MSLRIARRVCNLLAIWTISRELRGGSVSHLWLIAGLTATTVLLGGCQTSGVTESAVASATATAPAPDADVAIDATLMNEPCVARIRLGRGSDKQEELPIELYCAGGERPAGVIYSASTPSNLLADPAGRREQYERVGRGSSIGRDLAQRMNCQPGSWGQIRDVELYVAPCTLKSGNLPAILTVMPYRGRVYVAESVATLLPVTIAAVRWRGGQERAGVPLDDASRLTIRKQLELLVGTDVLQIPAADILAYQDLTERARLANSTQDFEDAEAALRKALDVQSRLLPPTDPGIGETLTNLALEVSNQGRSEEADGLFRRAEPIIQRSVDQSDYPRFLSYLAMHQANQRNFTRAIQMIRDVTARRRSLASGGGGTFAVASGSATGDLAHGLMIEAALALRLNQLGAADSALTEARKLLNETSSLPPWWRPALDTIAGELSQKRGQSEAAEKTMLEAVNQRRVLFGATWPTAVALMDLGRLYNQTRRHDQAMASFRAAFAIMAEEGGRKPEVLFEQIAPFMLSGSMIAKEAAPDERDKIYAEMFRANQLIRDGVASQTIAMTSARLATDDPNVSNLLREQQEVGRERDTVQLELAAEVARPDNRRDRAREASLRQRLQLLVRRVESLDKDIKGAFPGLDKLMAPRAVDIFEVQAKLDPKEAVAVIALGRNIGFLFLVKKDSVSAVPLSISESDVREDVVELRKPFEGRGGIVGVYNVKAANRLYEALFGEVSAEMADVDHLIMVPAGALSSLPPALLVSEAPKPGEETDYTKVAFLPRRMATSLSPSVRAFLDLRALRGRTAAPMPFLGFGDPTFEGASAGQGDGLAALNADCRVGAPLNPALLRSLAPLPETADEVRRIAQLMGGGSDSVILRDEVSDETIRQRNLSQYRVLYFATHGLLPGELKCQGEPGLALSPPRQKPETTDNDGLLSTSKIARLRLNAELVVLSACNTGGSGGKFGGGALSGLAESFFYAGARSLLVSHWQVPSLSTVQLMTGMFERLGGREREQPGIGKGSADALRQSQLVLMDVADTAHPYFWAAFTLVGESGGQISKTEVSHTPSGNYQRSGRS